jgi:Acyl-CoA thioesterase N-terminal domain
MTTEPETLFTRDGEWFVPTALTTGPWRPDAMHGGPPSALFARAIEQVVKEGEHVARLDVSLERPVPLEPLRIETSRQDLSRRVQRLESVLWTAERRVASARTLLLRTEALPPAAWTATEPSLEVPGPEFTVNAPRAGHSEPHAYHRDAVEHRFIEGGFEIPGEQASGLVCLMAAADFGSAISQALERGAGVALINVDVCVALCRPPVAPWIRLDGRGYLNPDGAGLAVTQLHDVHGAIGVITQSQLGHSMG